MSERRKARAAMRATVAEERAELLRELGLCAVATSGKFLLGDPAGASECYARVAELARRLQLPAPPPFDEFVIRYNDARASPFDTWFERCGL